MRLQTILPDAMKSSSLLWDDETTAWEYFSGETKGDTELARNYFAAVPTVFRGITKIADQVAKMPFAIYREGSDDIVDQSGDYQNKLEFLPSPQRLFSLTSMSLDLTGTAYLKPLRQERTTAVKELRYWSPATVTPEYDKVEGELSHFIRQANKKKDIIQPDELVYIWLSDPFVELGPPGAYPAKSALVAAGVLNNLGGYVTLYFERGAVRPIIQRRQGQAINLVQ
jgi:phage portal protein BeeE